MNENQNCDSNQEPRIPARHIVVISGFRQEKGRATTGVDRITEALHAQLAGPETWFYEKQWNDDFAATAAQIAWRSNNQSPQIMVVAYSWGVGNGAVRLAKHLNALGLNIDRLYSIDGVYRSPNPLMRWRSLLRRSRSIAPRIAIPANVHRVYFWRQESTIPQGHELVPKNPKTTRIIPGILPDGLMSDHTHLSIDNSRTIREQIAGEASQ